MAIVIPDKLEQRTHLHGAVNGEQFSMRGGGHGRPHEGEVATDLRTNPTPVTFPMGLMAVGVIMGFPTFSKYPEGTHDLFKKSDGYRYERHLRFENGGHLDTENVVTYHGDRGDDFHVGHLDGDFRVTGTVHAPELESLEELVERFEPAGRGKINSTFRAVWRVVGGGTFTADVTNVYQLNHEDELPFAHNRHISFDGAYTPTSLRQSERLVMSRA